MEPVERVIKPLGNANARNRAETKSILPQNRVEILLHYLLVAQRDYVHFLIRPEAGNAVAQTRNGFVPIIKAIINAGAETRHRMPLTVDK